MIVIVTVVRVVWSPQPFDQRTDDLGSRERSFSWLPIVPETSARSMMTTSAIDSQATPAEEGCPTPLAWQDVLTATRQDGRSIVVESGPLRMQASLIGQGPPLYLLPGFVGTHELYALVSWLLRDEFTCVMLDTPSFVGVRQPAGETLRFWAAGLDRLAAELGHDRLRLHATSLGSLPALRLMVNASSRVQSASLHCGFARWSMSFAERMLSRVGQWSDKTLGASRTAMRFQHHNHQCWFPPFDHSRPEFYANDVATTPLSELAARSRLACSVDLRDELSQIETPVLLIDCEGDGQVSLTAQHDLSSLLPNSRSASIDNCGRLPHVTHPHRLVKVLQTFWDEIDIETTP